MTSSRNSNRTATGPRRGPSQRAFSGVALGLAWGLGLGCSLQDFSHFGSGGGASGFLSTGGVVVPVSGSGGTGGTSGGTEGMGGANSGGSAGSMNTGGTAGEEEWVSLPLPDGGVEGSVLSDPSFEEGVSEWNAVGSALLTRSSDRPRSGEHCMRVSGRGADWSGPGFDMTDIVVSGQSFSVSLWLRNLDAPYRQNLTLQHTCTGETEFTYTQVTALYVPLEWTEISATFTVPECDEWIDFVLFVENETGNGFGDFDVDDVYILPQ